MKENLLAPLVFGPKMKMMEQKAFWMHMKMFSTFMMNKMSPGFSLFQGRRSRKGKGKGKVAQARAGGRGRGGRKFFKSRRKMSQEERALSGGT